MSFRDVLNGLKNVSKSLRMMIQTNLRAFERRGNQRNYIGVSGRIKRVSGAF